MAVRIKHVPAECNTCGEQTAFSIVDGEQLALLRATLTALLAAGWRFVAYDDYDGDAQLVCGGCHTAMDGLPGGRGA
jgi:hypothetical protein